MANQVPLTQLGVVVLCVLNWVIGLKNESLQRANDWLNITNQFLRDLNGGH